MRIKSIRGFLNTENLFLMMNRRSRKMNLEKLRKQTKKNWKREMWSEYKRIM